MMAYIPRKKDATMLPDAAQALWKSLRKADRAAVKARVAALKKRMPDAEPEELHRLLVQSKCLQAGAIGALSATMELLPGAGKIAGMFLGPVIDTSTVVALQAELVLETFAVYDVELGEAGERFSILAIAATNVGATHASSIVAKLLKRYAGAVIGGFVLKRALPITNIATAATKNIALTYAVGMRAQAVAKFRDAELEEWPKLMKQVTNIDEGTLVEWATSAARTAIDQVQESAKAWVGRVSGLLPSLPDFGKLVPKGDQSEVDATAPTKAGKKSKPKLKAASEAPVKSARRVMPTSKAAKPAKATKPTKASAPARKPKSRRRPDPNP